MGFRQQLCSVEKRVLSTVEWVVAKFGIDRNRVYLNGISMGGSGSLGIGMIRGGCLCVDRRHCARIRQTSTVQGTAPEAL